MGKLSVLLVGGAVLASLTLTRATRDIAGETSRAQSERQSNEFARQIAETGQRLVLTQVMGPEGLRLPDFSTQEYGGGSFDVAVALSPDRQTARITVTGRYGISSHRLVGEYALDPISYPGPIWLDVPYATSQIVSGRPEIRGGATRLPVRMDRRRHDDLRLEDILPMTRLTAGLSADVVTAGSSFSVPTQTEWGSLLEDLNVESAEDLYQTAVEAMTASDRTLAGPLTLTSRIEARGPTTITRVPGALTVTSSGRLEGEGVLIVEGGLIVQSGGRLRWRGLVIVRTHEESLPVHLLGDVRVEGGLVVVQDAHPPIGHMDVTTFLDHSGMRNPEGNRYGPWWLFYREMYPFFNHVHHWESNVSTTREVRFAEPPASRHETRLFLGYALRPAGSTPVYLEFGNPEYHGHTRYNLHVASLGTPVTGMIQQGFPEGLRDASSRHRSVVFPANQLQTLTMTVQSLPTLKRRFDDEGGCREWPRCVGADWDRSGALSVRVVRASDQRRLYETALYWHLRTDEMADYEAALAAWRATVASGVGFGTHLRYGSDTRVHLDLGPILTLSDRLGFDRNSLRMLQATASHTTASDGSPSRGR